MFVCGAGWGGVVYSDKLHFDKSIAIATILII